MHGVELTFFWNCDYDSRSDPLDAAACMSQPVGLRKRCAVRPVDSASWSRARRARVCLRVLWWRFWLDGAVRPPGPLAGGLPMRRPLLHRRARPRVGRIRPRRHSLARVRTGRRRTMHTLRAGRMPGRVRASSRLVPRRCGATLSPLAPRKAPFLRPYVFFFGHVEFQGLETARVV